MNRKGFTLIELLLVVVIIGFLAAIAIPKFDNTKAKAYIASMKSDLRNLVFFFNDTATTEIYSLSLHAALPISTAGAVNFCVTTGNNLGTVGLAAGNGGGEQTTEHQKLTNPVGRRPLFINTAVLAPAVSGRAPAR